MWRVCVVRILLIFCPLALDASEAPQINRFLTLVTNPLPFPHLAQSMIERALMDFQTSPMSESESQSFFARVQLELSEDKQDALFSIIVDYSQAMPGNFLPSWTQAIREGAPCQRIRDLMKVHDQSGQYSTSSFLLKALGRSRALKLVDPSDEAWARQTLGSPSPSPLDLIVALKTSRRFSKALSLSDFIYALRMTSREDERYVDEIQREVRTRAPSTLRSIYNDNDSESAGIRAILSMPRSEMRAYLLNEYRYHARRGPWPLAIENILQELQNRFDDFDKLEVKGLLGRLSTASTQDLKPFRSQIRRLYRHHPELSTEFKEGKELRIRASRLWRDFHYCRDFFIGLFKSKSAVE